MQSHVLSAMQEKQMINNKFQLLQDPQIYEPVPQNISQDFQAIHQYIYTSFQEPKSHRNADP